MCVKTREWITHVGKGWAVDESLAAFGFDADVEVSRPSLQVSLLYAVHVSIYTVYIY